MLRSAPRFGLFAAMAAGAVVLWGCQTDKATSKKSSTVSMGAVNDSCPSSGKPVKADAGTASWKGKTIGFCCPNCVAPWNAMSAKDKDAFVAGQTGH